MGPVCSHGTAGVTAAPFQIPVDPGSDGGGDMGAVTTAHERTARFTFRRPPEMVFVDSAATASTLFSRALLMPAVLDPHAAATSAAAPETCGVAMDVPLRN